MKKILSAVLSLTLALGLAACGQTGGQNKTPQTNAGGSSQSAASGTAAPEFTIRYSHGNSEGSLVYMVAEHFAQTVQEKTGGRIAIEIYPSGQLSSGDDEAMSNLMGDVYEMSPAAPSALAKYSNMPQYNILDFPYMFQSVDESLALTRSDLWKELDAQFEEAIKVRPLIWYTTGSNAVGNSKRPITSPADMQGLKLRTASSDVFVDTVSAIGGSPIAMAFGETFTAVQQGTVDGIVTPFVNFWKEGFYDVTTYVTQLQSSEFYHCLMITSSCYNSFPDDLKALFDEAVEETNLYAEELGKQFEQETVPNALRELNVELVQLTDEQKAEFTKITEPVREKYKDSVGTDFYDSVTEFLGTLS